MSQMPQQCNGIPVQMKTVIVLQLLQFPAKTELKEVHHALGSALGSSFCLPAHAFATSLLLAGHGPLLPLVSMGRGGRRASRSPPWCLRNPGKVTTFALAGGCQGFVLNEPLAPVAGVGLQCVSPKLRGGGTWACPGSGGSCSQGLRTKSLSSWESRVT